MRQTQFLYIIEDESPNNDLPLAAAESEHTYTIQTGPKVDENRTFEASWCPYSNLVHLYFWTSQSS
jgi:hypothetical protein